MSILRWLRRKAPTPAQPSPSPDGNDARAAFAAEALAVLRDELGVELVEYVPEQFALKVQAHGQSRHAFLENVFAETRELSPEERRARIAFVLQPILQREGPDDWEAARLRLRAVLRPCAQGFFVTPDGVLSTILRRSFLPFLDARAVVDEPASMQYVAPASLERWGVEADEVFAAADRATAPLEPELELYDERHGPVFHLPGEDVYASSRLLVPGWLAGMRGRVEGNPIAIVPERTTLYVAGAARPELVEWLARKAQVEWEQAVRDISPAVYTVDAAGRVVPYVRPGKDPLAQLVRRGHHQLRAREYALQQKTLDEWHEHEGIDVFVASLKVNETRDGRWVAWTTWTEGVEALLPEADVVMAGCSAGPGRAEWQACVPFARAREIAGASWEQVDVGGGPPRHRTHGDISPAQREALVAAELPFDQAPPYDP